MTEGKDKMQDLFSSKLKNFEPEVPDSVWGGIEQILSTPVAAGVERPSAAKKLRLSVFRITSIAASFTIIVAIVAANVLLNNNKDIEIIPVKRFVKNMLPLEMKEEPLVESKTVFYRPKYAKAETVEIVEPEVEESTVPAIVHKRKNLYVDSSDKLSGLAVGSVEYNEVLSSIKGSLYTQSGNEIIAAGKEDQKESLVSTAKAKGFTFGVSADLGLLYSSKNQSQSLVMFSDEYKDKISSEILNPELGISEFRIEHNQPISFGLTVSKDIAPRLSVSTGLYYTYLSSSIVSQGSVFLNEKQKFHYLGIPLSLDYVFWKSGKADFYMSLGVMGRKDFKGSYESDLTLNKYTFAFDNISGNSFSNKESIHQNNIQVSSFLNVGVSYPVYKRMYLFGAIGGEYYFDAKNKYRTIFSDKDFQLDLKFGLRLGF